MTRWPLPALFVLSACTRETSVRPDPATTSPPPVESSAAPTAEGAPPASGGPSGPAPTAAAGAASGPTRAWQTLCVPGGKKPGPPKSLREVDWCNSPAAITTLKDGKAEYHEYEDLGGPHDTYLFRLGHVAYGDLDGDGVEDAVVTIDEVGHLAKGGQYAKATVTVWRWTMGSAAPTKSVTAYGVVEATIAKKVLEVRSEGKAESCVQRYAWKGVDLAPVGPPACAARPGAP